MNGAPLSTKLFIHFDDGDPGGIMFFPNYFRLSERAFELALVEDGVDWREWFDHPQWAVPLRHVEAEYRRPLTPGQFCRVDQCVARLGQTSVTLNSDFFDQAGNPCATVTTTHVFIDRKTMKSRPIPDALRRLLEGKMAK